LWRIFELVMTLFSTVLPSDAVLPAPEKITPSPLPSITFPLTRVLCASG